MANEDLLLRQMPHCRTKRWGDAVVDLMSRTGGKENGIRALCAAIGITSFSRVLSFALRRFHDITISVLAGFMLGSLNKVWPWKETIETYTDSHGVVKPLVEANIMPNQLVWEAVGLMVLGYAIVYFLEKLSMKTSK